MKLLQGKKDHYCLHLVHTELLQNGSKTAKIIHFGGLSYQPGVRSFLGRFYHLYQSNGTEKYHH